MNRFFKTNLISIKNLMNKDITNLFNSANSIKNYNSINYNYNKGVGLLFFQPSTRTRMSFEIASKKLGLNTLLESNPTQNSAMAKQETLHDVLKTMSNYVDLIVLRHPDENKVFKNIKGIDIPIINGGWGNFEHPTQALIDLYTFQNEFNNLKNTKMSIVGDPNTRTAKSISQLCQRFDMDVKLIYPEIYQPDEYTQTFENIICNESIDFKEEVKKSDILYYSNFTGTNICNIRDKLYDSYYLDGEFLKNNNLYIYSPLPRRPNEMDISADNSKYQLSFKGVENSVFLRMALINKILTENS
jgi:aspartate carbamoyltransferase catalytic subunit